MYEYKDKYVLASLMWCLFSKITVAAYLLGQYDLLNFVFLARFIVLDTNSILWDDLKSHKKSLSYFHNIHASITTATRHILPGQLLLKHIRFTDG